MKTDLPVTYTPNFMSSVAADASLAVLWEELAWVRHDKVPRREYYVSRNGADYSYGRAEFARTYRSQPLHPRIQFIWSALDVNMQARGFAPFDVCFLNGYEDGRDQLGWHADNSPEMDDARPIAIVSLGAERDIWFRGRPTVKRPAGFSATWGDEALTLQHGSLCVMAPGMQDTHQHRIPKAGRVCGPRVSLTFRGYVA